MNIRPDQDFAPIPEELAHQLIDVSRGTIAADLGLAPAAPPIPATEDATGILAEQYGAFVTIDLNNRLRGCIGSVIPTEPLGTLLVRVTRQAAFQDPRFPAVQSGEFPRLAITHSILSPLAKAESADEIELGRHGIVFQLRGRSSVFLPEVPLQQGWNLTTTLAALARKAGLPDAAVHDPEVEISLFVSQHYGEGLP